MQRSLISGAGWLAAWGAVAGSLAALFPADLSAQGRAPAAAERRPAARERRAAAREVLVRFRHDVGKPVGRRLVDADIQTEEVVGTGRWRRIRSRSRTTAELLAALATRLDVEQVEPNYEVAIAGIPNDLGIGLWALDNSGQQLENGDRGTPGAHLGALAAWQVTTGSRNIVVGLVDTGVMSGHQDLAANLWRAPRAYSVTIGGETIRCEAGTHGFNALDRSCVPADDHGHGTHVAGSIGAVGNNGIGVVGVNWATSVMALKFLNSAGTGYVSDAIDAIEFAIQVKQAFAATGEANIRILNNSWTGGDYSQALRDAIQRAQDADMLFVASAGNSGVSIETQPVYPAAYGVGNMLAVAATDYHDRLSSFSNFGANVVHLTAPGALITSTAFSTQTPGASTYTTYSGTSMAAAHVSGTAALVLSACSYSTGALRDALLRTSAVIGGLSGRVQGGRRVDAAAAVRSCRSTAPPAATELVFYASDVVRENRHGGWVLEPDPTAAGGARLRTADRGWASAPAPLPQPADYFELGFTAPANVPYRIWVRMRAEPDSKWNDSVWLQFSDALVSGAPAYAINSPAGLLVNLEDCRDCGVSGWGWQDGAYWQSQSAVVTFAASGAHTLRVQTREDGVAVDQIVLSPVRFMSSAPGSAMFDGTIVPKPAAPTGSGPATVAPAPYGGVPAGIPGTIEAEHFDVGPGGVAYFDRSPGNTGGAYRQTDVDLESTAGGFNVGWIESGEWLAYTVDVAASGAYTAEFRVASQGQGGIFHLEVNGADVTGPLRIPDTGGWQSWQTVRRSISLPAGRQTARLVMDAAGTVAMGNIDRVVFAAASAGGIPYGGTPVRLPGTVDLVRFDEGANGVAYHDTSAGNTGGAFRLTDVDLEPSAEGGFNVGWIAAGEWLNYTVDVAAAGAYVLRIRTASPAGAALRVAAAGADATGRVAVPATGGWQNWTTVSVPVNLSAGRQSLRLLFETGGLNVRWLSATSAAQPAAAY